MRLTASNSVTGSRSGEGHRPLTNALRLDHYAIYVFDYGARIGFRRALAHPERITAIISQNGNAYEAGLSEGWDIQKYWKEPTNLGFQCEVALCNFVLALLPLRGDRANCVHALCFEAGLGKFRGNSHGETACVRRCKQFLGIGALAIIPRFELRSDAQLGHA